MLIADDSKPENKRARKELKKKRKKKLDEEDDGSTSGKKKQYADDNVERKKKIKKKKKVFDLPGQKHDPPDERDPLRIFYETLYKHKPHCEIAQIWLMESGLLSREEAEKIHTMKQSKSQENIAEAASSKSSSKSVNLSKKAST